MSVMRSTYVYKVLKSSWGIWISLTAAVWSEDAEGSSRGQSEPSLEFLGRAAELPPGHLGQLRAGWSAVSSEVASRNSGIVRVVVEDVKFVDTDFQAEGLAVAMCRWAEDAFKLQARDIDVTFDSEGNKYIFTWPD